MFGGGPIFEGRNEIESSGKALKFKVVFQIYELKWIKIWKIIVKIATLSEVFNFWGGGLGKNNEYNINRL